MSYINNPMNVREFYRMTKDQAVYEDESFERPHGNWNSVNINGFIGSLFRGHAATPIVMADVNACQAHSDVLNDLASRHYYNLLTQQKKRFVSLDGKHRRECIRSFLNNEISYTGKVTNLDGDVRGVRNKFFKDLDPSEQQHFLNSTLSVIRFESLTQSDLSSVFLSLNANSSLTNQHKRNALQTPVAEWTRKMRRDHKSLFASLCGAKSFASMKPEEYVSKVYQHCVDIKSDVGDGALNSLYHKGVGMSFNEAYSGIAKQEAEDVLDTLTSLGSVVSLKPQKRVLLTLASHSAIRAGYFVGDEAKFCENIFKLDERLEQESRAQHVRDVESSRDIVESDYYFEQKRQNWSPRRADRQQALWDEIIKNPESYGLENSSNATAAK